MKQLLFPDTGVSCMQSLLRFYVTNLGSSDDESTSTVVESPWQMAPFFGDEVLVCRSSPVEIK